MEARRATCWRARPPRIRIPRASRRRCATPRAIWRASTAMRGRPRATRKRRGRSTPTPSPPSARRRSSARRGRIPSSVCRARSSPGSATWTAAPTRSTRRAGWATSPGERETAQLAGGYMERGDSLWQSARELRGMPQERDYLTRASEAYQQALDLYTGVPALAGVPASVRRTQAGLAAREGPARRGRRLHVRPRSRSARQRHVPAERRRRQGRRHDNAGADANDNQSPDDGQQ